MLKLMAAPVIELLRCPDQTDIAFLDQIQERNATPHILLGDADYQAGVGSDQMLAGCPAILDQQLQVRAAARANVAPGQLFTCQPAAFDALSQLDFLFGGQQGTRPTSFKYKPIVSSVSIFAR